MTKTCIDPKKARKIAAGYPQGDSSGLIHALKDVQAEFGYIPCEAVEILCEHLEVPISKAFSATTFYKAFSLEPKGEIVIRVCTGTACHIRGAQTLADEISTALGIEPGGTTKDLKFTLETVNCVGACAMAPVVSVDGKYHGSVGPGSIMKVIKDGK